MQRRKVAIFGGTFDPVHIGHVALVVALKEAHDLDLVLIIPANQNPLKKQQMGATGKQRLNMLKMAFKDLPYCKVLSVELTREGISYTIDTVDELKASKALRKSDKLFLILGEDQIKNFHRWKKVERLMEETLPLVAKRFCSEKIRAHHSVQKWLKQGKTETSYFEISATDIRQRLKNNLYCGHLLKTPVYNYIKRHALYG